MTTSLALDNIVLKFLIKIGFFLHNSILSLFLPNKKSSTLDDFLNLYFINLFFKFWNILFNRIPQNFPINTKIFMNNFVSHTNNFLPGNILVFRLKFCWHFISRLANNF